MVFKMHLLIYCVSLSCGIVWCISTQQFGSIFIYHYNLNCSERCDININSDICICIHQEIVRGVFWTTLLRFDKFIKFWISARLSFIRLPVIMQRVIMSHWCMYIYQSYFLAFTHILLMPIWFCWLLWIIVALFLNRLELHYEELCLRQQIPVRQEVSLQANQ